MRIHPSHTFLLCPLFSFLRCHDQLLRDKNSRIYCSSHCSLNHFFVAKLFFFFLSQTEATTRLIKTSQSDSSLTLISFHFKRHVFIFLMPKMPLFPQRTVSFSKSSQTISCFFSESWSILTISSQTCITSYCYNQPTHITLEIMPHFSAWLYP